MDLIDKEKIVVTDLSKATDKYRDTKKVTEKEGFMCVCNCAHACVCLQMHACVCTHVCVSAKGVT